MVMRRTLLLLAALGAGGLAPLSRALAHGVIGGNEDAGNGLFWVYGLVLAAVAGFIIYRKWGGGRELPERRALKSRLKEFERALGACMTQLKNADDYPKECGLTAEERRERLQSAVSIQREIDEIKADLAAT